MTTTNTEAGAVADVAAKLTEAWLCIGRKHGGWRCYSRCMYDYQCLGSGCGGNTLAVRARLVAEQEGADDAA